MHIRSAPTDVIGCCSAQKTESETEIIFIIIPSENNFSCFSEIIQNKKLKQSVVSVSKRCLVCRGSGLTQRVCVCALSF